MCGFAGIWDTSQQTRKDDMTRIVRGMADTLVHRGPDDSGVWQDEAAGIALGFRRLSIIDLSPGGKQPMASASGRYVIVFNGEVYNYESLRQELKSHGASPEFRGSSDTEVILAAVDAWGLEAAVQRFIGMFAFALWDRENRRLCLVRDRLGVKPLYYGWSGKTFLFGSELKALLAFPGFRPEVDRGAVALYMRHSYVPAPYSIWKGVNKLAPATILTVTPDGTEPTPAPYWSALAAVEAGAASPFGGSDEEAIDQLDGLLRDAVRLRMIADVPLGVFLSGGLDSSVVTAQMQALSSRPVQTFTVGFHEDAYNEASYAGKVARRLGCEHTELYVSADEARGVIPRLPTLYDEPFADSSQIPTYLIATLARRHVTVALSGDGGDELFGGYNRHLWGRQLWRTIGWMPPLMRRAASRTLTFLRPQTWDHMFQRAGWMLPRRLRYSLPGEKLAKLAEALAANSPDDVYRNLVSHWKDSSAVTRGQAEPPTALSDPGLSRHIGSITDRMMYLDLMTYLPDDILVKVDRASMGVGLEAREPLLDHRLVQFAWSLPMHFKIRNGEGKWLLRQVLDRYVPRPLMQRPKMGFSVPLESWLRGPLRAWAEELLDERRLADEGFLDAKLVRAKWAEHLSGRRNWQNHLWVVLMFQAWLEQWGRRPAAGAEQPAELLTQ